MLVELLSHGVKQQLDSMAFQNREEASRTSASERTLTPLGFIKSGGHGTVHIVWNTGLLTGWESQIPACGVCILYVC